MTCYDKMTNLEVVRREKYAHVCFFMSGLYEKVPLKYRPTAEAFFNSMDKYI